MLFMFLIPYIVWGNSLHIALQSVDSFRCKTDMLEIRTRPNLKKIKGTLTAKKRAVGRKQVKSLPKSVDERCLSPPTRAQVCTDWWLGGILRNLY